MTVGIFGGSFNPVHNGHIALARAIVERGLVDEVWLTLSPLNPLKNNPTDLLPDNTRLEMLRLATEGIPGLRVCDIELTMPRPSFTINTLRELSRRNPGIGFRLIIGADNMLIFDRWKEHDEILRDYAPIVYPRPGFPCPQAIDLPVHDVSSTLVRNLIAAGDERAATLIPAPVLNYITSRRLYSTDGCAKR